MSDAVTGGVWISSTPTVATIGVSSGIANGVSAGTTTLTYTVTNSFGCPASVTTLHTVLGTSGKTMPSTNICVGTTAILDNQGLSGTWSSANNKMATVTENGVISAIGAGSVDINFTSATGNENDNMVFHVTVSSLADAGTITGPSDVTVGATIELTAAVPNGAWSSSNVSVATVSEGAVSALAGGTADIIYTVANQCGSSAAKHRLSVATPGNTKTTGITETVSELSVYPNPNNGQFTVILKSEKDAQMAIIITDVKGAIVSEMTCGTNQLQQINLNQPAGIYVLNVVVGNYKYVQKLIIE